MILYRFHSFSANNIDALGNRYFWASKPAALNDPFESPTRWAWTPKGHDGPRSVASAARPPGPITKTAGLVSQTMVIKPRKDGVLDSRLPGGLMVVSEEVQRNAKNVGIVSFSKRADRSVMWSHYADQHRGFVLEFDIAGDIDNLFEVIYGPTPHFGGESDDDLPRLVSRYKAPEWEGEQEYRLILDEGSQQYAWPKSFRLTAIIYGMNMLESHKKTLATLIEAGVNEKHARPGGAEYSIVFDC